MDLDEYCKNLMEQQKIEERRKYMRRYYIKNKYRYKGGKYKKKKCEPIFKIEKREITLTFD